MANEGALAPSAPFSEATSSAITNKIAAAHSPTVRALMHKPLRIRRSRASWQTYCEANYAGYQKRQRQQQALCSSLTRDPLFRAIAAHVDAGKQYNRARDEGDREQRANPAYAHTRSPAPRALRARSLYHYANLHHACRVGPCCGLR